MSLLAASGRPIETHTLHFDLAHVDRSHDFTLHVCMESFPLTPHDEASLRRARQTHGFLRHVPDQHITHYVEGLHLPQDAIALVHVTRPVSVDGGVAEHTVHMSIHVPTEGRRVARQEARKRRGPRETVHPKLRRFGVTRTLLDHVPDPEFPDGIEEWQDAVDAATALLYHHPSLINLNADNGGAIPAYIIEHCIGDVLASVGDLPAAILAAGDGWMTSVPARGPDGQPLVDSDGHPVYGRAVDPDVQAAVNGALALAILMTKDDQFLKGQQWSVQYGVTSAPYDAKAVDRTSVLHATAPHHPPHPALEKAALAATDPYRWALKNLSPGSGLSVDPGVSYEPPSTNNKWVATGIWSELDTPNPFDAKATQALLAGNLYVKISTPDHPEGLLRGQLVATAVPQDREAVSFTATLTGAGAVPAATTTATATGTFNLNSTRSGLAYDITATGLGASASASFGIGASGEAGKDAYPFKISDQAGYGTLTVTATNAWLRHLSACVQFTKQDGTVITPEGWSDLIPSFLAPVFQPNRNTKFVKLIPPVRTVFGIPLPADSTSFSFPVPDGAQRIRVMFGGLGRGTYDSAVCPVGIAVTVTCEMAIPVILLTAGTAVMNSKTVVELLNDTQTLFAVCRVASFLVVGASATYIGTSQSPRRAVEDVAIALSPVLLSATFALGRWLIQEYAKGLAARAVPFLNIATTIISGAVTAAQLSQTIIEVLESPFVFESEVTRSIDLKVTLTPDHDYHRFPDQAATYLVRVVYDQGATVPDQTFTLPGAPPWSDPIDVTFAAIPAGGRLKVYVFFYAPNGWQAGQGESPWFEAKGTSGSTLTVDGLEVTTNIVPLTSQSVYVHRSKIAYDPAQGGHYWMPSTAPTATLTTPSPFPDKAVQSLLCITTAQKPAQMAYAWEATGLDVPPDDPARSPVNTPLYTIQNLSTLQHPDTKYAVPAVGFSIAPGVFYDLTSPEDGSGRNFYIDPTLGSWDETTNPGGGLHVRRVALTWPGDPPQFPLRTNRSWGRFPVAVDRYVLHPQGYVLGINFAYHKLYILRLAAQEVEDTAAPFATMASGQGVRDGLVAGPQAIAAGMDGRVLILESLNHRVQAFDISGNPVPYFKDPDHPGQKIPTMALSDPDDSFYLDLAVEPKGYLYVLRFRSDGSVASKYQVDLYQPDGTFLVTTTGVAAAKIAVDILRNMFALNYEVILAAGGRPEPSVSLWIPPAPPV